MGTSNGVHDKKSDNRLSPFMEQKESRPALSTCDGPEPREGILAFEKTEPGKRGRYVVYSPALRGFWTHWNGKKSVPCYEDHSLCEGGHKLTTLRQNFALHAWDVNKKKQVFVYLTPGAAAQLQQQTAGMSNLRGIMVDVWRTSGREGRMNCSVSEAPSVDKRTIPPEMDAYLSIMNFLKVEDVVREHKRKLGSPNDAEQAEL